MSFFGVFALPSTSPILVCFEAMKNQAETSFTTLGA